MARIAHAGPDRGMGILPMHHGLEARATSQAKRGNLPAPRLRQAGRIAGPHGGDPTVKLHFTYDAWNRQVKVQAGS